MKYSFWKVAVIGLFMVILTSCGAVQSPKSVTSTGTAQGPQTDVLSPMALEKSAPSVEESLEKVGKKLQEEPVFRACIARSTQMCSSEVVSRFVQEKDSDKACGIFDDIALKTSCVNAINMELARKTLDVSLCDKVAETSKAQCIQQATIAKAVKEKDIKACAALKPPKIDNTATGAMMPPSGMNGQSQCIVQVVMMMDPTEKTLGMCKSIEDDMMQQNCISMVQSRIDMQKNIPKLQQIAAPESSKTITGSVKSEK